jgi:hypothetical protein
VQLMEGSLREGQELVVGMKGAAAASSTPAQGGSTKRLGF